MSKYNNKKTTYNDITFDSKKEMKRYIVLRELLERGEIQNLELQKKFVLIPSQRARDTYGVRGGVKKGKLLEREVSYYADFCYEKDGKIIVEDVKGMKTDKYIIKRKLMLWVHGILIQEV